MCPYFVYLLVYTILLNTKDIFNDSNTIENYNKTSVKIINSINKYLFILVASVVVFYFASAFYIFNNHYTDHRITKFIKSFLMILFSLIGISFEGLVIWKFVLSYKVKESGVIWFMVMDYFFIFLNLFYIIFMLAHTHKYCEESGAHVEETIDVCALTLFDHINILHYTLPGNFEDLSEKERKKLI